MVLALDRIEYIEALAQTTLDEALQKHLPLPIPIRKVVTYCGLTLQTGEFDNPDISGSYDRVNKTISVSNKDPYTRAAFTIAHEIGHYLLHSDKSDEIFYRSSLNLSEGNDNIEAEANCFAASLLMPRAKMRIFYPMLSSEPEKLADLFGVSKIAMNYRIKNMGLR